ncbi:hypothetical protein KKF60_02860 [Patescibacteria group bacterium]|nr:hypothetical protein [Patescibacteria group bacterium]
MDIKDIDKRINQFLTHKSTSLIFLRPYSFPYLFAIYHAYTRLLKRESGCLIYKNVLIYKNSRNLYEFFVNFKRFTGCLVKKINSNTGNKILHQRIIDYYEKVREFKSVSNGNASNKTSDSKVFYLASEILAFEALTFIIPYLAKDLKIPIKDKLLVKKCEQARIKTEKLFTPGGEMDNYLLKNRFLPAYLKRYKPKLKEFILFEDIVVTNKKTISEFKQIKRFRFEKKDTTEIKGITAYKGKVRGKARIILSIREFSKMKKDDILIAHGTTPDYLPVIKKASAIISDEGGFLCHAAIVSREMKIPCIMGTKIATKVFKDGDLVEVDANKGIVKIIKKAK